jgi:hypothetical protein
MINEKDETFDDEAETMRNVMKDLERHKTDIPYNSMIEKRIRGKLQKDRNKKV